jgi:hypothetical protein
VAFAHNRIDLKRKLKFNGSFITTVDTVKFLGVNFTYNLNWRKHIEYIEKKCENKLNLIRILTGSKWGANAASLLKVYRIIIRPLLLYGSVAFNTAQPYILKRLDHIQFRALKLATGALAGTPLNSLLIHTGELPLALQRHKKLINLFIKNQQFQYLVVKICLRTTGPTIIKRDLPTGKPYFNRSWILKHKSTI